MGQRPGSLETEDMTALGKPRFVDGLLLAALIALAVLATLTMWKDILRFALSDAEHSYILLTPAIVGWLIWVRRERLRHAAPRWTLLGAMVILLSWGLGTLGHARGILAAEHLSAVGAVAGAALTIVGVPFFRAFAPAVAAMLFFIPVPGMIRQQIAIPLQEVSARITFVTLDLFGAPVTHMGNVLNINGQDVAVAEACNGMRMAAALALVTYTYVFSVPLRQGVRILLVALTPLIAVLCNVIRLIPSVLFYGYGSNDAAEVFHDASGWGILVVALFMLWMIAALLRWLEVPIEPYAVGKGWTP